MKRAFLLTAFIFCLCIPAFAEDALVPRSIESGILGSPDVGPSQPYAMEHTFIYVLLENTGSAPISRSGLEKSLPDMNAQDFVVEQEL